MRFYFNPIIARLIPYGYDANPPIRTLNRSLSLDINTLNIFDDKEIIYEYVKSLEEISSSAFLSKFLKYSSKEVSDQISIINKSYPHVKFLKEEIYKNQKYIKARLNPDNPIGARIIGKFIGQKELSIEFYNKIQIPIEIKSIEISGNKYLLDESSNLNAFLPGNNRFQRFSKKVFNFKKVNSKNTDQLEFDKEIKIQYKLYGSRNNNKVTVNAIPWIESLKASDLIVKKESNISDFKNIEIDKKNKKISH